MGHGPTPDTPNSPPQHAKTGTYSRPHQHRNIWDWTPADTLRTLVPTPSKTSGCDPFSSSGSRWILSLEAPKAYPYPSCISGSPPGQHFAGEGQTRASSSKRVIVHSERESGEHPPQQAIRMEGTICPDKFGSKNNKVKVSDDSSDY